MSSVLVVDDELSMREFLEIVLTKEGYEVHFAASGEEAYSILEKEAFDLVITDIRMEDIDGLGVLRKVKEVNAETPVIIISAFATAETAVEAMKDGAYDYIPKPFNVSDFKKIVRDAFQRAAQVLNEDAYASGCRFVVSLKDWRIGTPCRGGDPLGGLGVRHVLPREKEREERGLQRECHGSCTL